MIKNVVFLFLVTKVWSDELGQDCSYKIFQSEKIDVQAQKIMNQQCIKGDDRPTIVASRIRVGECGGIYQTDQGVSAKCIRSKGGNWWTYLGTQNSKCCDNNIIIKKGLSGKDYTDALTSAYSCCLDAPYKCATKTTGKKSSWVDFLRKYGVTATSDVESNCSSGLMTSECDDHYMNIKNSDTINVAFDCAHVKQLMIKHRQVIYIDTTRKSLVHIDKIQEDCMIIITSSSGDRTCVSENVYYNNLTSFILTGDISQMRFAQQKDWYSGKVVGVKFWDTNPQHDLPGIRVYFTETKKEAQVFIDIRQAKDPQWKNSYMLKLDTNGLNTLDLTQDPVFMRTINFMKSNPYMKTSFGERGEYQKFVVKHLESKGVDHSNIDAIIIPNLINGENQIGVLEIRLKGRVELEEVNGKVVNLNVAQLKSSLPGPARVEINNYKGAVKDQSTKNYGTRIGAGLFAVIEILNIIADHMRISNTATRQEIMKQKLMSAWELRWAKPEVFCCIFASVDPNTSDLVGDPDVTCGVEPQNCRTWEGDNAKDVSILLYPLRRRLNKVKIE